MRIAPIRTDAEHAATLQEIERLWGAEPGTEQGDLLDVLVLLVEAYEAATWPTDACDPIGVIEFVMEQRGATKSELANVIGSFPRVSEVLSRKRPLTLPMIWRLHEAWGIPAELLIRPYATQAA